MAKLRGPAKTFTARNPARPVYLNTPWPSKSRGEDERGVMSPWEYEFRIDVDHPDGRQVQLGLDPMEAKKLVERWVPHLLEALADADDLDAHADLVRKLVQATQPEAST